MKNKHLRQILKFFLGICVSLALTQITISTMNYYQSQKVGQEFKIITPICMILPPECEVKGKSDDALFICDGKESGTIRSTRDSVAIDSTWKDFSSGDFKMHSSITHPNGTFQEKWLIEKKDTNDKFIITSLNRKFSFFFNDCLPTNVFEYIERKFLR